MNLHLIALILIPLVILFVVKYRWYREVTGTEMALFIIVAVSSIVGFFYLGRSLQARDTEIWSGEVTSKHQDIVSCSHSYQCFCTTDSEGYQTCQTCYDHSHDYDWTVDTNVGALTIARIDSQSAREPLRFTAVRIGEPASVSYTFENYIKAVPDSLFNQEQYVSSKYKDALPRYPGDIHDYYRINRAIAVNVEVPDLNAWSAEISEMEKRWGPQRHANVILIFTSYPLDFSQALKAGWLNGKKNDIVIVIGAKAYPAIDWVYVFGWSKNETTNIEIRDQIIKLGKLDRSVVMQVLDRNIMSTFVRRPMEEYAYLKDSIEPSTGWLVFLYLFSIIGSAVAVAYIVSNEHTN